VPGPFAFERDSALAIAAIGVVAGLFAAMFGIGGGIVVVPLLLLLTTLRPRHAAATSLAAVIIAALIGVTRYAGSDYVNWAVAGLIAVPAVLGLLIGLRIQARISGEVLTLVFGLLVLGIGLRFVIGG
jgi:uncharacterized membrane protein YfcA